MITHYLQRQVNHATSGYHIRPTNDLPGTIFTTAGNLGVDDFWLPRPTVALRGWRYEFINLTHVWMRVFASNPGELMTLNQWEASSVAFMTDNQMIGAHCIATCLCTSHPGVLTPAIGVGDHPVYQWVIANQSNATMTITP